MNDKDRPKDMPEELQQETRNLLDAILEQMPSGVIVADPKEEKLLLFNHRASEIWQLPLRPSTKVELHKECRGFHPDGRPYQLEDWPLIRSMRHGEVVVSEHIHFLRGDGTPGIMSTNSRPIFNVHGDIVAGVTVFEDITEQKRLERDLHQRERELRTLVENSPDAIVRYNEGLERLYVNPALERLYKIPASELEGKVVKLVSVSETETVVYKSVLQKVFETGKSESVYQDFVTEKGVKSFQIHLVPEISQEGGVDSVLAIGRDITELKKLQDEMRRANVELEQRVRERTAALERSNQALQEFASMASHDLQEPLRKIQSFGGLLREKSKGRINEDASGHLERMLAAAERMSNLIGDLLDYSRVTTKAKPFKAVNLNKLLQDVVSDLEFRVKKTDARIELEELPEIGADPTQMRQLFQNLIGNALKFCEEKPLIKVYGGINEGYAEISVEDNGIGFDEKSLDRIFRPFQRLHGRSKYEGAGIGLAIVQKIVERHSGSITARSAPGKGSTFTVRLPVSKNWEKPVSDSC